MSEWRAHIRKFLQDYGKVHVYAVDPGAVATLTPFYEEALRDDKAGLWFAEGWALQNAAPHYVPADSLSARLNDLLPGDVVLMGQQVNFEQAYDCLALCKAAGVKTVFVSDHWKEIASLFAPRENDPPLLPDRFLAPDIEAFELQRETLTSVGLSLAQVDACLEVFLHPGVERALDDIRNLSPADRRALADKYGLSGRTIVMYLDNVDRKGTEVLGFDWQNCLALAIRYMRAYEKDSKLLVKPHPRQDIDAVRDFLAQQAPDLSIELVTETAGEPFIAVCDEIWGMTTVLLVIARKYGKPIRAFMAERTLLGALDSNPHIESCAILGPQDFAYSRTLYASGTPFYQNSPDTQTRSPL